jgi:hypothetical protein
VETLDDMGFNEVSVRYHFLIGPIGESDIPIGLSLEDPFQSFSSLSSWSTFDLESSEGTLDVCEPGDVLAQSLHGGGDVEGLIESLIGAEGGPFQLRRVDWGQRG